MPTVNLTAAFVKKVKPKGKRIDYFDDSLPGFSLRVSEKGIKTWCVSYRFGGKWTRYTFASFPIIRLAEARQTATDALHDVAHGINPATKKKAERNSETFDYLASEYLERHAKPKKKSWEEDERIINTDLLPALGGTRAKEHHAARRSSPPGPQGSNGAYNGESDPGHSSKNVQLGHPQRNCGN